MEMKPQMPKLSIIVVVYCMSRQAMNTLYSLSVRYQQNVSESDYEILVMENLSADNLDPSAATSDAMKLLPRLSMPSMKASGRRMGHLLA